MSSSDDTTKIKRKLSTLTSSLHDLETNLAELLSQSLPELVLDLDTIQQAKLQVVIPYLAYDLVFVYLKTRGLDPKTHPVIAELDRVRQYFDKIKDAEDPAKRQLAVDKAAATRFIKNAIAQAKDTTSNKVSGPATHIRFDNDESEDADGRAHDVRVPAKVIDDEEPNDADAGRLPSDNASSPSPPQVQASEFEATALNKDKGKGKANEATAAGKRRRPAMDFFAGLSSLTSPHIPSNPNFYFPQAMAMAQILALLWRSPRPVLRLARRDLARRFEEFI
ncbi:Sas10/Utp3/C1D family-domain-containing protein [Russula compacta]|nr:Sas10/Utp3/C1D family-domain-containing protein [Russula compacta]